MDGDNNSENRHNLLLMEKENYYYLKVFWGAKGIMIMIMGVTTPQNTAYI